jgi:hypothetical protein
VLRCDGLFAVRLADYRDLTIRIILLIWGSFIPSIFYGFGGDMEMVKVYWVMVSFNLLLFFIMSLQQRLSGPAC